MPRPIPRKQDRDSVHFQGLEWIAGKSIHNKTRNECTPDFSCCVPKLFETDRAKRIRQHNQWCAENGYPEFKDD